MNDDSKEKLDKTLKRMLQTPPPKGKALKVAKAKKKPLPEKKKAAS